MIYAIITRDKHFRTILRFDTDIQSVVEHWLLYCEFSNRDYFLAAELRGNELEPVVEIRNVEAWYYALASSLA